VAFSRRGPYGQLFVRGMEEKTALKTFKKGTLTLVPL
jgi:hypothetical protein